MITQRRGVSESKLVILDVKNPNNAKLVKNVQLSKRYGPWVKSYISSYNNNSIKIILFNNEIKPDSLFSQSFCEISFDFNTLKYSINDKPAIQTHFVAARNIEKTDAQHTISAYKHLSQTCAHICYKSRYLVVFGSRKIIFYDSKRGVWNKCRYDLPFKMTPETNVILIGKHTGKQYLHFVRNFTHLQLELNQCESKELWKRIRLIWIGFYKNHVKKNQHGHDLANSKAQGFCMFGQLPKAIVKHIMSFLMEDCPLYFLQKA